MNQKWWLSFLTSTQPCAMFGSKTFKVYHWKWKGGNFYCSPILWSPSILMTLNISNILQENILNHHIYKTINIIHFFIYAWWNKISQSIQKWWCSDTFLVFLKTFGPTFILNKRNLWFHQWILIQFHHVKKKLETY